MTSLKLIKELIVAVDAANLEDLWSEAGRNEGVEKNLSVAKLNFIHLIETPSCTYDCGYGVYDDNNDSEFAHEEISWISCDGLGLLRGLITRVKYHSIIRKCKNEETKKHAYRIDNCPR